MNQRTFRAPRARVGYSLAIVLAWAAGGLALADGPGAIDWRADLARAEAEARSRNLPLWIQFTGPWCHNCVRLERESLPAPGVVRHARESFIPVKLRADIHEEQALRYELTGLPATVIVAPSGAVIARHEGFVDAATFQTFLESSLARFGPGRPRAAVVGPPEDGVELAGFCPVSLVSNRRLVPGQPALTLVHEGRAFRFADVKERDEFRKQPEAYVPVNGGRCPVSQVDRGEARPGDPRFGVVYQGHLYLCADAAIRDRFLKDPDRYAQVDVADRGFCPHCWSRDGLLVRGLPQYSLTRDGRRYLFPGPDHRDAFRADGETVRR